jgi:hypothetical protein
MAFAYICEQLFPNEHGMSLVQLPRSASPIVYLTGCGRNAQGTLVRNNRDCSELGGRIGRDVLGRGTGCHGALPDGRAEAFGARCAELAKGAFDRRRGGSIEYIWEQKLFAKTGSASGLVAMLYRSLRAKVDAQPDRITGSIHGRR